MGELEGLANMVTVKATEMKNKLGHYLQVALTEPVVVEKTNQQVAVLMSMKEYERLTSFLGCLLGRKSESCGG